MNTNAEEGSGIWFAEQPSLNPIGGTSVAIVAALAHSTDMMHVDHLSQSLVTSCYH